ncbi:MAG: tetratricopeptide repeat protein [Gemmatimonadota bacterium]|nr:tetratricopeptide repeat protein [Gemmatimonadota bacterium]
MVVPGRNLVERRVPHVVAIYAGASWGLIEFTGFVVDEFLLSPHWTRLVLVTLVLLLPSVILLAWFHGKPGRDRDSLARTEKIGIPANLVLCGAVLWMLFGGEDLGAATTEVTVETEDGDVETRTVAKAEFRKATALFSFDLGPGIGEDRTWIAGAVPEALVLDLLADDFFNAKPHVLFGQRLVERGYSDYRGVPLTLKRELAEEAYAEFLVAGEIDRTGGLYRAALRVHRVDNGSLAGEAVHEGTDLLALMDELSAAVKRAVGIPDREDVQDLPLRDRLSDDDVAVEEYFRGTEAVFVAGDLDAGIRHATAATTLDPTFAVAQFSLYSYLVNANRSQEALAAIEATMRHLHRLPERTGLFVKTEYFFLIREIDKADAVTRNWVDLYPDDPQGLAYRKTMQDIRGDEEGALATLETMYELDPRNGGLLKLIAEAHEELGDDGQALAALAGYVDAFPEDATGYASLAALRKRLGDYDGAREDLGTAILMEPLSAAFTAQLARLDLDAGDFAEAGEGYRRALAAARTPAQKADVLDGLKHYHRRRGEVALAVEAMEAWLDEASAVMTPMMLTLSRGDDIEIYLDAGRVSDAAALLEELSEQLQPPFNELFVPLLTTLVTLASLGPEAAREAHRRAAEVVEEHGIDFGPTLLRDMGRILEREGDHLAAAESYREAMATDPGRNQHLDAGRALRLAGRLDEAEAELREALRRVPGGPRTHFEMALLLEGRGDVAGAVEHLERALEAWENADEDYEPARAARAKLAELRG